ncbi:hypothetical protein ACQGRJ_21670 [Bacillus atrophaeus]|uniref:hypothetical protein n=1 Tax=Bacillus atrophaeus TaxID=1452 RepID=UPI003CF4591F
MMLKLTKEQAEAIEEGVRCYEAQGLKRGEELINLFLFEHYKAKNGLSEPWEGPMKPLNSLSETCLRFGLNITCLKFEIACLKVGEQS